MMKTYIGVKRIQAEPQERDGKPGYKVRYADGYESWSPADVFERVYLPIDKGDSLTENDIDCFIEMGRTEAKTIKERCTFVVSEMPTGFLISKTSACVDKSRYSEEVGEEICMEHIRNEVWQYLGFVLCWAKYGVQQKESPCM